jgi:6-phospho-3-hexuloisomerase
MSESREDGLEVKNIAFGLLTMITQTLSQISEDELGKFVELLAKHHPKRILLLGAGRSGLVARSLALRLLHLGYEVYVLGDTIVPSVSEKDLVIAISGSGTTRLILTAVEAARNVGATIVAITSFPESPLAKLADNIIVIKGRVMEKDDSKRDYFARQILGLHEPLAPLGTLFEDTCMVALDALVSALMDKLKISETEMKNRHANIE